MKKEQVLETIVVVCLGIYAVVGIVLVFLKMITTNIIINTVMTVIGLILVTSAIKLRIDPTGDTLGLLYLAEAILFLNLLIILVTVL